MDVNTLLNARTRAGCRCTWARTARLLACVVASVVVSACSNGDPDVVQEQPATRLADADAALRVSMALRGVRASAEESAGRDLRELARAWAASPEFLQTVHDVHLEGWWLAVEEFGAPPAYGALRGFGQHEIRSAMFEEVPRLVVDIVADGRPYTDIVRAPYTMANNILAEAYGLPFDHAKGGWQRTTYADGRPPAGVLSTNGLWLRHFSGDANANRHRAWFVERALLCRPESPSMVGEVFPDTSDPEAVANAVQEDPACVSCHASLDPLASHFFGFRRYVFPFEIREAFEEGCRDEFAPYCYPISMYDATSAMGWREHAMKPPDYFGRPSNGLTDLGAYLEADPAFSRCTVERFWEYFAQSDLDEVPESEVSEWVDHFVSSGFDIRSLSVELVTSDRFMRTPAAGGVGPLWIRPNQHARQLEALTGLRWTVSRYSQDCLDSNAGCMGDVPLLTGDDEGFRVLAGGSDGWRVMEPMHEASPARSLVYSVAAETAAAHVVRSDLANEPSAARLLRLVRADTRDPEMLHEQIRQLSNEIMGKPLSRSERSALVALWTELMEEDADAIYAWEVVVAALLQDPSLGLY